MEGFLHGLSVATVAIFAVVLAQVLGAAKPGFVSYAILVAAFGLGMVRRIPLVVIILGASLVGVLMR